MTPENRTENSYCYGHYDGYESRLQRRLQHDLGVDQAAAETILRLHNRIIELQSQIRQLETELAVQRLNQDVRLSGYRDVYYEATWIELDF